MPRWVKNTFYLCRRRVIVVRSSSSMVVTAFIVKSGRKNKDEWYDNISMIREKVGIRGIKSNKSFAEKIQILSAVRRFFLLSREISNEETR